MDENDEQISHSDLQNLFYFCHFACRLPELAMSAYLNARSEIGEYIYDRLLRFLHHLIPAVSKSLPRIDCLNRDHRLPELLQRLEIILAEESLPAIRSFRDFVEEETNDNLVKLEEFLFLIKSSQSIKESIANLNSTCRVISVHLKRRFENSSEHGSWVVAFVLGGLSGLIHHLLIESIVDRELRSSRKAFLDNWHRHVPSDKEFPFEFTIKDNIDGDSKTVPYTHDTIRLYSTQSHAPKIVEYLWAIETCHGIVKPSSDLSIHIFRESVVSALSGKITTIELERFWSAVEVLSASSYELVDQMKELAEILTRIKETMAEQPPNSSTPNPENSGNSQSVVAPTAEDNEPSEKPIAAQYIFRWMGHFWEIVFENESMHISNLVGVKIIHHMLSHPYEDFVPEKLEVAIDPEATKRQAAQGTAPIDARAESKAEYDLELANLNRQLRDAVKSKNVSAQETIKSELRELETYMRPLGLIKPESGIRTAARTRVGNNYRSVLSKLEKDMPNFCKHLDDHMTVSGNCRYSPPKNFSWIFQK